MKSGLILLLTLLLIGCGEKKPDVEPSGLILAPAEPEAALAWVREVEDDPAALRARLDVWPFSVEAFTYVEETQLALTWRLQLALRDGDVERAGTLVDILQEQFEGVGQYPEGRELSFDTVRLGVFEEALLTARRRINGVRPELEAARSALDVAKRRLQDGDAEDQERLRGTTAWVERATVKELLIAVGSSAEVPAGSEATLLVLADDFALGESLFFEVLKQWAENHAGTRFERRLVPLLRGQVRFGLRLVPAESRQAEIASIEKRCGEARLVCEKPLPVERLAALGLGAGDAALVLADGKGRIVARLCGRNIDPRVLEPALQRLLSR